MNPLQWPPIDAGKILVPLLGFILIVGSPILAAAQDSDTTGPRINRLGICCPQWGRTFSAGEKIEVGIWYDEPLHIFGTPRLTMQIGTEVRSLSYRPCHGCRGNLKLVFDYIVQPGDYDEDGLTILSDALSLPAGAYIRDRAGNDADLDLGDYAQNPGNLLVDGTLNIPPSVHTVRMRSTPNNGDTYVAGELIEITVSFNEEVFFTGSPRLAIEIGEATRLAAPDYRWPTGLNFIIFNYRVATSDKDTDGISISADALRPNGAILQDRVGNNADLAFGPYNTITNDPNHRVDGGGPYVDDTVSPGSGTPSIDSVRILSEPEHGDTYAAGYVIRVRVLFDTDIGMEWSGARPQMALARISHQWSNKRLPVMA